MAASIFLDKIGYVQGMNIIISSLLYSLLDYDSVESGEEEVFWLFISLMKNYKISQCFSGQMERIFELSRKLEIYLFQKE